MKGPCKVAVSNSHRAIIKNCHGTQPCKAPSEAYYPSSLHQDMLHNSPQIVPMKRRCAAYLCGYALPNTSTQQRAGRPSAQKDGRCTEMRIKATMVVMTTFRLGARRVEYSETMSGASSNRTAHSGRHTAASMRAILGSAVVIWLKLEGFIFRSRVSLVVDSRSR
jgi:hypothetical protein